MAEQRQTPAAWPLGWWMGRNQSAGSKYSAWVPSSQRSWVLGGRFVQMMLNGDTPNAPFSGTGHIAFDNVTRNYQAAWMDTGSTAITLYTGKLDASGKAALMKGSMPNALTGKPSPVELRMTIQPDGSHLTQLWGHGKGAKMVKLMELQYTKVK